MITTDLSEAQLTRFKDHHCPFCGLGLMRLSSMNKKVCIKCDVEFSWPVKDDELPLISHQR